jgi:hypothetical protein
MPFQDITHLRLLRRYCTSFLNLPNVVEADVLETHLCDIGIAAVAALKESCQNYREFVALPEVNEQFEKWLEGKEE